MTKAFRFSLTAPLVIIITLLVSPHAINASALLTESSITMTSENSSRSASVVVVVGGEDNGGRRRGSAATMRQRAELPPPSSSSLSSSLLSLLPAYHRIMFSYIDGTLVHYPAHRRVGTDDDAGDDADDDADADGDADEEEPIVIRLPPSKTGTRGIISARTLSLCHRLRHGIGVDDNDDDDDDGTRITNGGVPFVLVSGMCTTTLFQRLPYLPRADAYVSKIRGGIFYPSPFLALRSSSDLVLQALAEVQQTGGTSAFLDTEPTTYHCLVQLDCVGV